MTQAFSPSSIFLESDDLFNFAEVMKVSMNCLPQDSKCLFKNSEEAEMWRHKITSIQPAQKIKEIRKQLLVHKINQFENDSEETIEISNWKKLNNLRLKLKCSKENLQRTHENLKHKLSKAKLVEIQHDEMKEKNSLTNIKKATYRKLSAKSNKEVHNLNMKQTLFQMFRTNTTNNTDIDKKLFFLYNKIKETIDKNNKCDNFNNILEHILFDAPKNVIYKWLFSFSNNISNDVSSMHTNISHDENEHLISKFGITYTESVAKLSAEHVKLNINIVKNNCMIKKYKNDYILYLNNLRETHFTNDIELERLDTYFHNNFFSTKKDTYKDRINKLNLDGDLSRYESKSSEILKLIKEIDMNTKSIIHNLENFDHMLVNTPQKIVDVLSKNCEEIQRFQFYNKNNPDISISYREDSDELKLFANMDVLETPSLIHNNTQTHLFIPKCFISISNKSLNLLGWESIPQVTQKILEYLKNLIFYKQNKPTYNVSLPSFESNVVDLNRFQDKIKSIENLQSDMHHKIENVQHLSEFWDRNDLKNYLSCDRFVDCKPYKYYEDLLLEYKKLI